MRVIYTGFLKTGSRSICTFVKELLNYKVYFGASIALHINNDDIFTDGYKIDKSDQISSFFNGTVNNQELYDFLEKHEDMVSREFPYFGMYKYINEKYSDSKFILCIRDTDSTFESYKTYMNMSGKNNFKINNSLLGVYGNITDAHKEKFKSVYEKHNSDIIEYFKDKPDKLLVLKFEDIGTPEFENKIKKFINNENSNIKMKNLKNPSQR